MATKIEHQMNRDASTFIPLFFYVEGIRERMVHRERRLIVIDNFKFIDRVSLSPAKNRLRK